MNYTIWVIGLMMVLGSIYLILSTEKITDDSYIRCYYCEGTPCDCENIVNSHYPENFWLLWGTLWGGGMILMTLSSFMGAKE